MKIGIFGDSFAAHSNLEQKRLLTKEGKVIGENMTLGWPEIIESKYQTKHHAQAGSSLIFSVNEFMKYHSYYDKIIFVLTQPGRVLLNNEIEELCNKIHKRGWHHIAGISDTSRKLKNFSLENSDFALIKKAFHAAQNYYYFIQRQENEIYLHKLMIEDIKKIRSDIIFIPAFATSFGNYENITSMWQIMEKEDAHWRTDPANHKYFADNYSDLRHCHLTEENNFIFAEKVFQWLNGNSVVINLDDFVCPKDPITRYFIPI